MKNWEDFMKPEPQSKYKKYKLLKCLYEINIGDLKRCIMQYQALGDQFLLGKKLFIFIGFPKFLIFFC